MTYSSSAIKLWIQPTDVAIVGGPKGNCGIPSLLACTSFGVRDHRCSHYGIQVVIAKTWLTDLIRIPNCSIVFPTEGITVHDSDRVKNKHLIPQPYINSWMLGRGPEWKL